MDLQPFLQKIVAEIQDKHNFAPENVTYSPDPKFAQGQLYLIEKIQKLLGLEVAFPWSPIGLQPNPPVQKSPTHWVYFLQYSVTPHLWKVGFSKKPLNRLKCAQTFVGVARSGASIPFASREEARQAESLIKNYLHQFRQSIRKNGEVFQLTPELVKQFASKVQAEGLDFLQSPFSYELFL